jgi:hypothetical protein
MNRKAGNVVERIHPTVPQYELRIWNRGPENSEIEIWELPSVATPHLKEPLRVAGLHGRNLSLIEPRLIRRFKGTGIDLICLPSNLPRAYSIHEDLALSLGLMFRVLAPMRNRDLMRGCVEGIEKMTREEAAYWLGMAMHRKNPRRVLKALRTLLS